MSQGTLKKILSSFTLENASIEPITHKDSLSSVVYKISPSKDRHYICKLSYNKDRFRRESYYLDLLKEIIPVPKIIDTLPPHEEFSGALLLEYIEGDIVSPPLLDNFAFQMGKILATLHSYPVSEYGDLSLGLKNPDKGKTAYVITCNRFETLFEECSHILSFDLLKKCESYFQTHIGLLKEASSPCITHRDFRPGNMIAKEDTIQAVIDFENTRSSFPEEDFMQMQMLVWQNHPKSKDSFLAGYESISPLPPLLSRITPLLSMLFSMGSLGFTYERKTWKDKHKFVFDMNVLFLKHFFQNFSE